MDVSSLSGLSRDLAALGEKLKENKGNGSGRSRRAGRGRESAPGRSRRRIQQELADLYNRNGKSAGAEEGAPEPSETPAQSGGAPPSASEAAAGPDEASAAAAVSGSSELQALAARYVAQYERGSGTTLSDTERDQRITDVAQFYSAPQRQGRLENIVFE